MDKRSFYIDFDLLTDRARIIRNLEGWPEMILNFRSKTPATRITIKTIT